MVQTDNAVREVALPPVLTDTGKAFIGSRTSGFVFETDSGRPRSLRNILTDSLETGKFAFHYFVSSIKAFLRLLWHEREVMWYERCKSPEEIQNAAMGFGKVRLRFSSWGKIGT